MSQSQAQQRDLEQTGAAYGSSRDWHYWPRDEAGTPVPPEVYESDQESGGHAELEGTSRAEWVGFRILFAGDPELLSPIELNEEPEEWDLFEHKGERVPISDSKEVVPMDHEGPFRAIDYQAQTQRVSDYGYVVSGPIIANRPKDELMPLIEAVLDNVEAVRDGGWQPGERGAVRARAEKMKEDGGPHDVTIMAEVVRCIDNPGRALED